MQVNFLVKLPQLVALQIFQSSDLSCGVSLAHYNTLSHYYHTHIEHISENITHVTKRHQSWQPKFGYQIWFCTRLYTGKITSFYWIRALILYTMDKLYWYWKMFLRCQTNFQVPSESHNGVNSCISILLPRGLILHTNIDNILFGSMSYFLSIILNSNEIKCAQCCFQLKSNILLSIKITVKCILITMWLTWLGGKFAPVVFSNSNFWTYKPLVIFSEVMWLSIFR